MSNQTINPIGSSASSTTNTNSLSAANTALNQQAFLQLLSTQLANQDPTAPQDESQMLAQLAQFSTVQGVEQMATSQTQLQASGMLGKTVTATDSVNNAAVTLNGPVTAVSWNSTGDTFVTINDPTQGNTKVNITAVTGVSNGSGSSTSSSTTNGNISGGTSGGN